MAEIKFKFIYDAEKYTLAYLYFTNHEFVITYRINFERI